MFLAAFEQILPCRKPCHTQFASLPQSGCQHRGVCDHLNMSDINSLEVSFANKHARYSERPNLGPWLWEHLMKLLFQKLLCTLIVYSTFYTTFSAIQPYFLNVVLNSTKTEWGYTFLLWLFLFLLVSLGASASMDRRMTSTVCVANITFGGSSKRWMCKW